MHRNYTMFTLQELHVIAQDTDNTLADVLIQRYEDLLDEAIDSSRGSSYDKGYTDGYEACKSAAIREIEDL